VVALEQNYRSTKRILEIASAVIVNNTARKDKRLWTENREGERALVYRAWDENEESAFVAQKIRALHAEGRDYRDVAIFYRTNAQSRVLEDALRRASVPYLIVGGVRFYERREIRDMVAYLRLISTPLDDVAVRRAVAAPARGIGKATLDRLADAARAAGVPLLVACATLPADIAGAAPRPSRNSPASSRASGSAAPPSRSPRSSTRSAPPPDTATRSRRSAPRRRRRGSRTWRSWWRPPRS
jgi:DNA helicase-2/ATP-dependent DNA helicase PcrA